MIGAGYQRAAGSRGRMLSVPCSVLIDGMVHATWTIEQTKEIATLTIRPFVRLSTEDKDALATEGAGLLGFAAAGKTHDVRFINQTDQEIVYRTRIDISPTK
jgi:hypothetical protein